MDLRSIGQLIINHKEGDDKFLLKVEAYFTFLSRCTKEQTKVQWQTCQMWKATLKDDEKKLEAVKVLEEAIKARMLAIGLSTPGRVIPGMGGVNPMMAEFAQLTGDEEYFTLGNKKKA